MSKMALYLRLSVDEDGTDESNSITNQRYLLNQYLDQSSDFNHWERLEFVDDGFSGTSLNRPAFQRLMADVKAGIIRHIIVKDFSRFMRDYLELGNYLENIFPFLGVRFIAINDQYDSLTSEQNGLDIDVPFIKSYKNGMIMYSNDLGVSQNPRRCFSSYNSFYDLESYWKDKKNGFYTDKGEKITDAIYDYSYNFTEGYAAVKKDGKWAYIDTKGNNVTDFAFDKATPVVQGKAWVTIDGKSGVIDLFSTLSSNIEINNDTVRVKK